MAKEKPSSVVDAIRNAMQNKSGGEGGGGSMPEQLFFVPQDGRKVIRPLSEFDEAIEIIMHDKYGVFKPQPCLKYYDEECPFHGQGAPVTTTKFAWTVYEYETKQKRIMLAATSSYSPINGLMAIWDEFKTIKDRDLIIKRTAGDKTSYTVLAKAPSEFEGDYSKPFSQAKVFDVLKGLIRLRKWDPAKTSGNDEEEEEGDVPIPTLKKKKPKDEEEE